MKRIFVYGGIAVGAVVALIIVATIFIFSSLDGIVQAAVEKFGTEIVGANVELADVEISATSGKGALRGLVVGNPAPFKTESALNLGEIGVSIDPTTITGGTIVIKEIVIGSPEITYELDSGGSNIDAIQKNVENYLGSSDDSAKTTTAAAEGEDEGEGTKLVIENLIIRGGKIKVSATLLKGKNLDASLPDIHLKDIGKEEGDASPGDVVNNQGYCCLVERRCWHRCCGSQPRCSAWRSRRCREDCNRRFEIGGRRRGGDSPGGRRKSWY